MDYNIYIHDKTSNQKPTQPRQGGGANTTPKSTGSTKKEDGFYSSGDGEGIGGFIEMVKSSKGGKIALAVYATYKTIQKVVGIIDTIASYNERQSGDYRFRETMGNYMAVIKNFTNPLSYTKGLIDMVETTHLYNRKQDQERLLLGDSFLNTTNRRV